MSPTISYNTALVLQALSTGHGYGFEVMRVTGLPSGTVYPLLRRLEESGLVESTWEDVDPSEEGRPRRRYYSVTKEGTVELSAARDRIAVQQRLFGAQPDPSR